MKLPRTRYSQEFREQSLKEVEKLMSVEPNTSNGKKLDVLVTLAETYERKHIPLDLLDPVETIKF